jgi:RimJ/RimL family protein N-acetyltransferase
LPFDLAVPPGETRRDPGFHDRQTGGAEVIVGGQQRMERMVSLRQWKDSDLEPYAAMNADPEVMRFFPRPLTFEDSAASLARLRAGISERGWGLWAVDVDGVFAGFTGLAEPTFRAHFTPCVEIGWRLRREFWGQGVAYAAARRAMAFAFSELNLRSLVSFTSAINVRSRKLMERLGFTHDPRDDFHHPNISAEHPLCLHVLYRKSADSAPPVEDR